MRRAKWVAAAAGLIASFIALPSFAAATEGVLQLGLGFRYGASLDDGDLNPWGTGLGLEAGYTLPVLPIYVGGNAEYFFGGSIDRPFGTSDAKIWQLSAEGGYDFGVGDNLVIRPKLGLGMAHLSTSDCVESSPIAGPPGCLDGNDTKPLIAPGAKFILMFSRFELALDGRYAVVTSDPTRKAFIFSAGIGF